MCTAKNKTIQFRCKITKSICFSYSKMAETTATSFVGCEICIESFLDDPEKNICAIPCGHVFHESCLARWFQSQRESHLRMNCPKCRKATTSIQMIRLFLFGTGSNTENAPALALYQPNLDNSTSSSSDNAGANGRAHSNEEMDFSNSETNSAASFVDDEEDDDEEDFAGFDDDFPLGPNASGSDAPIFNAYDFGINDFYAYDSDETPDVAMNSFAVQRYDDYADPDEL